MSSYPGFDPPWRNPDGSWPCPRCGLLNAPVFIWCARCGLGATPLPGWYYQEPPPVSPPGHLSDPSARPTGPYQVPLDTPPPGPMPYGYLGYPPYRGQPRARRSRREWLGLFAILAVVLAILIIPTTLADIAAYQTVTRPDFPVAVNGATVTYYDITGATAQALADAMHTEGQTRCGATDAVACLSYGFDWTDQTTTSSAGVCKVTSVDLVPTYQMTLPRWVGPSLVPQGLVDWWRQVQAHLIWHESQHLAISQGYEPALRAAITAGPCDDTPNSPSAAVLAVKAALEVDQSQFDISDRGWTWPAYTGP